MNLNLFIQYKCMYPNLSREAIVEKMLDDGVINYKVADKLRQGSIWPFNESVSENTDITNILGGEFNKTNFNRAIESTSQSKNQGDCWLLSDINALSYQTWGQDIIRESIIPDGKGGVIVNFKGSPLSSPLSIYNGVHITAQQIREARESGNYSSGDDDMIAFELATEVTFRKMCELGLAKRAIETFGFVEDNMEYRSFINYGVTTDEFYQFPISKLLGLNVFNVVIESIKEQPSADKDKSKILKSFAQNQKNVSATCSFSLNDHNLGDPDTKDYIKEGHAYAIKKIVYGKEVIITNPYYSDYEIKISWKDFSDFVQNISFSCKDYKTMTALKKSLPHNYEDCLEKYCKEMEEAATFAKIFYLPRKTDKQKQQDDINKATERIKQFIKDKDVVNACFVFNLESDNVIQLMEIFPDIVSWAYKNADDDYSHNNRNRAVCNIIFALCHKAEKVNIDSETIEKFQSRSLKKLYAIFNRRKALQKEIDKMVELIKSKEQPQA